MAALDWLVNSLPTAVGHHITLGANAHSNRRPILPAPSQAVEICTREVASCRGTREGGDSAQAGRTR